MISEIIFDVETKKLFRDTETGDPAELGVSIVSTYRRTLDDSFREIDGVTQSYWEKDFHLMWDIFKKADRIIGFNSINFDVQALKPYAPSDFASYRHFDILEKVKNVTGRRFSLNSLAKDTLGKEKVDVGTNAVLYWNKGDAESLYKLQYYCEMDVTITKELYDYGFEHNILKYLDKWNTIQTISVDFSYPPVAKPDKQQFSLF